MLVPLFLGLPRGFLYGEIGIALFAMWLLGASLTSIQLVLVMTVPAHVIHVLLRKRDADGLAIWLEAVRLPAFMPGFGTLEPLAVVKASASLPAVRV